MMRREEKVACLGPEGSYSELAAKAMRPKSGILLCEDFPSVFDALTSGEADCAVVPIENTIQGGVLQNLDLLSMTEGVFETEEYLLPVDHRLATKGNISYDRIERVCSHEQALAQCSEFLQQYLPHAKKIPTASTAESLSLLDDRTAGIVGSHLSGGDLVLSAENIANEKNNFTRFMLLERRTELPACSSMVFFCAVCEHKPGALLNLLKIFSEFNLTRIESRPIRGAVGEYRFFIEFAGDVGEERVRRVLDEAKKICRQFRVLGAYTETPAARQKE